MKAKTTAIAALVLAAVLMGCESETRAKVRGTIKGMNERCPIVLSQYHSITAVDLDEDTIVYKVLTTEELASIKMLEENFDLQRKYLLMNLAQQEKYQKDELLVLANDKLWLKTSIVGQKSDSSVSFLFSPEEIKDAVNNPMDKAQVSEMMLQMNVEETKRMLPSEIEKGITWTDAELTGTSLTYTYKLNENFYDLSVAKENEKSIKESMIPGITADKPLVRALVNTKRTLCYKYVDKSKRSFTIKFEVHELKSLL